MVARRFFGVRVRQVLFGLALMLLAPLVGDARDLLFGRLGFLSTTTKYYDPFEFDRAVGRLVLFLGWCFIARGLGGNPIHAHAGASKLSHLSFRLRWLPAPMLATTGLYAAVALRKADAQLLMVDVSNLPRGTKLEVGGYTAVTSRQKDRYAEAIEYLFGIPVPGGGWLPTVARAQVLFHSEPQRVGLQNWQPQWRWLFITSRNEDTHEGAVVFLNLRPCTDGPDVLAVGKPSAVPCIDWYEEHGRCLVQNAYYRPGAEQIYVKADLTGLEPESYRGDFPPRYDSNLGGKWPECRPAGDASTPPL